MCEPGWTGARCAERRCDPRCAAHGQCKDGACLCVAGWNGRHCTLEGCPAGCSAPNGMCKAGLQGEWRCECRDGWEGEACDVRTEGDCSDARDNDGGEKQLYTVVLGSRSNTMENGRSSVSFLSGVGGSHKRHSIPLFSTPFSLSFYLLCTTYCARP